MSNKIFKSVFLTSVFVLIISCFMLFNVLPSVFEAQVFSELESEAEYISYGMKYDDFLENFENESKRITIISADGTVLYDTKANADTLESHADRKEFKDALAYGSGKSERYSATLTEKTLYYAVKLDNGSILRVSTTQASVIVIILGLIQPIICIVAIALIISLLLAYRVSNAIIKPINSLDLENPTENKVYDELTPLLKKLAAQKKTISRQIREAEKNREEFRLICENMNEGFLVIDRDARVLSYNKAALRLLGVENMEENNSILAFNRSKNFREVTEKALSGSRAENIVQTYNLIANPVYREGRVIGAVIVIIDLTESMKREQLRREFTSNVSHELKTPLTSISGFAEMMRAGGMPEETVIDFSSSIYDEAQRLITLVSDIIKISELDEGAVLADNEKVDLYSLSADIAQRLNSLCREKNITFTVKGSSAFVLGSEKILDEMISNLCDNAVKYNKPGGTVDLVVTSNENSVTLLVKDSGIGIPQAERSRVFERFYRVDKSRSKSAGGTGLGLAIVKHGAIYHNAEIQLESTEGKGTEITIIFDKA